MGSGWRRRRILRLAGLGAVASAGCLHPPSLDAKDTAASSGSLEQRTGWKRTIGKAPSRLRLTTDHSTVLLNSRSGRGLLIAYTLDGREDWRTTVPGRLHAVTPSQLILGAYRTVTAVDPASGDTVWTREFEEHALIDGLIATDSEVYLVVTRRGMADVDVDEEYERFYALDLQDGSIRWQQDSLPGINRHERQLHATSENILLTQANGTIHCFDTTGDRQWHHPLTLERTPSEADTTPASTTTRSRRKRSVSLGPSQDGTVYCGLGSSLQSTINALDVKTGEIRWQTKGYSDVVGLDTAHVYCYRDDSHASNELAALALDTGEPAWTWRFDGYRIGAGGIRIDDTMYIPFIDFSGSDPSVHLRAFAAASGNPGGIRHYPGNRITRPTTTGGVIFLATGHEQTTDGTHQETGWVHAHPGIKRGDKWKPTE